MGGSAQNTLLTCHKLAREYEMVLVYGLARESNMTDSESAAVEKQIEGARVKGVRFIPVSSLVRRISPSRDILALYELLRIIRKVKPDIVHTHTSKAGILGRLAAKIANVRYIIHTPHGHVFYGHFGPLLSRIFIWIEKLFSFFTDRMITLTEGEQKDYIERSLCPPEKLIRIHSGVDVEKFKQEPVNPVEKRRSLGLPRTGSVVGFVGWLLPIKGPLHLLRAMEHVWQDHDDTILVFIGKGELLVDLKAEALQISANGRVHFLGWRSDIHEIMPIFDIFVLPSLNEGMWRVLVEAMAAGKPIVASNVGGIPDLVQHGVNGLLVPPGDEEALGAGIKQLIPNPEKTESMGRQGRILCNQFSLEAMIEKIDGLYHDLFALQHPDQPSLCELRPAGALEKYETRMSKSDTNPKFGCSNFQNSQNKSIEAVPEIDQGGPH